MHKMKSNERIKNSKFHEQRQTNSMEKINEISRGNHGPTSANHIQETR